MNSPARPPPAHPVDQRHGADHQGDADGGGVEDAQGAAGGDRRAGVRAAALPHPAQRDRARARLRAPAARAPRGAEARRDPDRAPTRGCAARSTPTSSASPRSSIRRRRVFITAGRRAAQFVARTRRQLAAEFAYGDTPTFAEARAIAALARDLFLTRRGGRGAARGDAVRQHADPGSRCASSSCRSARSAVRRFPAWSAGAGGRRPGRSGVRARRRERARLPARALPEHLSSTSCCSTPRRASRARAWCR